MRLEIDIAEHHYNNIMALDSVSLGRVPYKGIIMYSINAIKHGKVLDHEPTTKNNSSELEKNSKKLEKDFDELDCISRERLKQIVFNITAEYDTETIHIDRLIDEIDNLPSVTSQELIDYKAQYERFSKKAEIVISQLRADRDRLLEALDKIRAEIKALSNVNPSYWYSGDMVDRDDVLDILDKYKVESEGE